MAKLTAPNITVTFTELGISAITRGDKGTVALIVRDEMNVAPFAISLASQIPTELGKENRDYIKRTFTGYINPPKKVIVYVAPNRLPAEKHAGLAVPEQGTSTDLGEMKVSGLVGADVAVGPDGCVTGTVKFVESWPEFNVANVEEQSGYYFPFHLDDTYKGKPITVQREGGQSKTATDQDWILRLTDGKNTVYTVKDGETEIVKLSFDNIRFGTADSVGDEELADALTYMGTQTFDYLCGPVDCTSDEAEAISSWVKSQRAMSGSVKYKAVLPSKRADNYAIVNFDSSGMTDGENIYTTAGFCSRMAGLIAGTPMKIACTYAPLPELSDVKRLNKEQQDEAVGAGKLILVWDGRKVKVSRGVNSFVTTVEGMLDSFKKIKIVEIMDLIRTDIIATAEDDYIGKYANTYDNKLLLITAIRGYFMGLERDELVQPGYTVDIDVEAQEQWLTAKGIDCTEMTEAEIRQADTGTHVFILIRCKILDAIEDIDIVVEI